MADGVVIKITGDAKDFENSMSKIGDVTKKGMKVAGAAVAAVGASLVALGVKATKSFAEYETSVKKVGTILDTTQISIEEVDKTIVSLSNSMGIAATTLNEATYQAISAGVESANAVDFVSQANKLAVGGFTDVTSAVDVMTTALNAYRLEADQAGKVSDVLVQIQNKGKTTVGELASNMGKVIPTANAYGVSLENLGASYALMTANGIATAETTTYVNSMLNELGKSGTKASEIIKKQTGKSFKELMESGSSLGEVLEILEKSAAKSGLAMADIFGSAEAGKAATVLLANGVDGFNSSVQDMVNSVGATDAAFETMSDTLQDKFQKTQTSFDNLLIGIAAGNDDIDGLVNAFVDNAATLGDKLLPVVESVLNGFANLFSKLAPIIAEKLPTLLQQVLPSLLTTAVSIVTALVNGLTTTLPALIPVAVEAILLLVNSLVEQAPLIVGAALEIIIALTNGIAEALPELVPAIVNAVLLIVDTLLDNLPALITAGLQITLALALGLINALPQLIEKIPEIINSIVEVLTDPTNLALIIETAFVIIFELAKALLLNLPQIASAITSLVVAIPNLLINALGGILQALVKLTDDHIITPIANTLTKMVSVGKDIVSGLWSGITEKASWLKNKITGFADGIITGIKEALDIHSPSRVMRDEVGAMIAEGVAVGIDKKSSAAIKKAEELAKATYKASAEWIEARKRDNELSLQEEYDLWKELQEDYKIGSEERIKAEKEVYRVKQLLEKAEYDNSVQWIERKKQSNDLSLNDELKAWQRVQDRYAEGTTERINAEQKIYDVKKQIFSELEKLENEYYTAVEDRTNEIFKAFSLFETVDPFEEVEGGSLLNALATQVAALESWSSDIQELAEKGIDDGLLAELEKAGPKSAAEVKAMLEMTEPELQAYSELYRTKMELARTQAESEMKALKENTILQTQELMQGVEDEFASSLLLGEQMTTGLAKGINKGKSNVIQSAIDMARAAIDAAKKELDINSPSRVMRDEVGVMLGEGLALGIDDSTRTVEQAAQNQVDSLLGAYDFDLDNGYFTDGQTAGLSFVDGFNAVIDRIKPVMQATARVMFENGYNGAKNGTGGTSTVTTNAPVINFYEPVESPDLVARRVNQTMRYGLAGAR